MTLPLHYPYNAIVIIIGLGLIIFYLFTLVRKREKQQEMVFTVDGLPIERVRLLIEDKEPFDLTGCTIVNHGDGAYTITITGVEK